ncbi:hypothetical protein [uncultured Marivirga sp.]|uniref:hypothetical protein n=1 Tax=uncultured Marivirga sp. TaxID=1123707 RepID=UPI0030EECC94|tara:strand:+ start:63435 stop:63734 length:300 start_codon:yes stop_codon:yes gene_type:complete
MAVRSKKLFLILSILLSNFLIIHSQSIDDIKNDKVILKADEEVKHKNEIKVQVIDSAHYSKPVTEDSKEKEKASNLKLRSATGLISFFNEVLFYWFQCP